MRLEWGPALLAEQVNIAQKLIHGVTEFVISQVHQKINTYHINSEEMVLCWL